MWCCLTGSLKKTTTKQAKIFTTSVLWDKYSFSYEVATTQSYTGEFSCTYIIIVISSEVTEFQSTQ